MPKSYGPEAYGPAEHPLLATCPHCAWDQLVYRENVQSMLMLIHLCLRHPEEAAKRHDGTFEPDRFIRENHDVVEALRRFT